MRVVIADGVVYMRGPMSQGAPTEWVSMDPTELSPEKAAQFGNFGVGTTDPSAYAGLFAGVGSLFFLAANGAFGGAVAGYLTARGLSSTFYSFVVTHSAFELTAIILAGAAGLRIGHALLAPGRRRRLQSLVDAAREMSVIVYGVTAMLFIAAAVEAFWSSAGWLPAAVKYSVAAVCWASVLGYFTFQGRRAS